MKKTLARRIILLTLLCMAMAGCSTATGNETQTSITIENASEALPLEDMGKIIAKSLDDLRLINEEIFTLAQNREGDIVAWVNGIPLRESELQLRKGLDMLSPEKRTEKELMERLIREKTQLSILKQNNISLSEQEIADFIAMEQSFEENGDYTGQICESGGMSEEDYWNVYEKYNVMRILVADKVYQLFLEKENPKQDIDAKYEKWMDKQVKKAKLEQ